MKTIDEIMYGCEHDGSYIPVSEVKRLIAEYHAQFKEQPVTDSPALYTKEQFLQAAEKGEVSMIDARHVVSLLDESGHSENNS